MKRDGTDKDPREYARELPRLQMKGRWFYLLRWFAGTLLLAIPAGYLLAWLMGRFAWIARYSGIIFIVIGVAGLLFLGYGIYRMTAGDDTL